MVLQAACQEVQASQLLIQLLQAVLGVGNYLNQGTFKGNAPGLALSFASMYLHPAVLHVAPCSTHLQLDNTAKLAVSVMLHAPN